MRLDLAEQNADAHVGEFLVLLCDTNVLLRVNVDKHQEEQQRDRDVQPADVHDVRLHRQSDQGESDVAPEKDFFTDANKAAVIDQHRKIRGKDDHNENEQRREHADAFVIVGSTFDGRVASGEQEHDRKQAVYGNAPQRDFPEQRIDPRASV